MAGLIFLTNITGRYKLVICMTTLILYSYPVNQLTFNQSGPSHIIVADNYEATKIL